MENNNKMKEQEALSILENKIINQYKEGFTIRNQEYDCGKYHGEMDLFWVRNNYRRVYIEIKATHSYKHYIKAKQQFLRAKKCNQADVFIYVTPTFIKRVYL